MISAVFETVIGLILIYFLLSLVCSGIQEFFAGIMRSRAKFLAQNLSSLLGENTRGESISDKLYNHPLIRALSAPEVSAAEPQAHAPPIARRPSYVPSQTFALALQSVLAGLPPGENEANAQTFQRKVVQGIDQLKDETFRGALRNLMADAGDDLDRWKQNLETWFDDTMERVSGWYKRNVKRVLMVVAAALTLALNADTIMFVTALWKDPAIRESLVAEAGAATEPTPCPTSAEGEDPFDCIAQRIQDVKSLEVPIGWPLEDPTDPLERRIPHDGAGWILKLIGLAVTWAALTRGAPFWFDWLNRLGSLRSTGQPPATQNAGQHSQTDRQ
jgi:hypothetical protein